MDSFCEYSTNKASASLKGQRNFSMIRDLSYPSGMISLKPFMLCFRNVLLLHANNFMPSSGLQMPCACAYCTSFCCQKGQFTLGFALFDRTQMAERLHRDMRSQKESNKKLKPKGVWFLPFNPSTEPTVCWMYPKALHITGHSFMIPLSLIFLNGWYFTKHEHHGL
jgi:hypothetical protein